MNSLSLLRKIRDAIKRSQDTIACCNCRNYEHHGRTIDPVTLVNDLDTLIAEEEKPHTYVTLTGTAPEAEQI